MSKFNKVKSSPSKKAAYPLSQYQQDIQDGVKILLDAVSIVNGNANIIRTVLAEVSSVKTITDKQREDFIEALNLLVQHTLKTIEELEVIGNEAIESKPEHFKGNGLKVSQWMFDIQTKVMDACAWIPELTPIYQGIIDELDKSKQFMLVDPAIEAKLLTTPNDVTGE